MYILDSIYGHIFLPQELKYIVNTKPFQRLRFIKQLGLVHFLYPGINHTRFEHSLGVAYLCYSLIKKIQLKQPDLEITDRDCLLICIAGLIHDLGHACFSHFFDDKLMADENVLSQIHENYNLRHHEDRSEYIFRKIVLEYSLDYTDEEIDLICSYVNPKKYGISSESNIKNKFRYEIVSNYLSGFDCDKLDYLERDATYLRHKINLNVLSLIDNATVIDDKICYPVHMVLDIYMVFQSRFLFHKKYYCNNIARSIEYMILDAMKQSKLFNNIADKLNTNEFYKFTDSILENMGYEDDNVSEIITNIFNRNLYKTVHESQIDLSKEDKLLSLIDELSYFLEVNELKDIFIFDITRINHGKGNNNPIGNMYFYRDFGNNKLKIVSLDENYINHMFPQFHEELHFRIFIKNTYPKNYKINDIIDDFNIIGNSIFKVDNLESLCDTISLIVNAYMYD